MQKSMTFSGNLAAKVKRAPGPGLQWRLRNLPNIWRGLWRLWIALLFRLPFFYGELRAVVLRADGSRVNFGRVSTRLVTTAFVNSLATYMFDGSGVNPNAFDYHDCGTGTGAEAISNTGLGTPFGGARVNGTPTNPSAGLYRSVATIAFTSSLAITEHGVFSASTNGTLLDRSVFSAINVVNGDSIQFTYTLTINAGG